MKKILILTLIMSGILLNAQAQTNDCMADPNFQTKDGQTALVFSAQALAENPVGLEFSSTDLEGDFLYIVTDEQNVIVDVQCIVALDISLYGPGSYRIWSASFRGDVLVEPGQNLEGATLATQCSDLSPDFLTLRIVDGPLGGPFKLQILHNNDGTACWTWKFNNA